MNMCNIGICINKSCIKERKRLKKIKRNEIKIKKNRMYRDEIDPEIYAYYTCINGNVCGFKSGCTNICSENGYCNEHLHVPDFVAATKHTYFKNTTQKMTTLKISDYSLIYAYFNSIPLEILLNIVRYMMFSDLKMLYTMRIPNILVLVQSDFMFNHDALYASSVLTTSVVRKFQSEYTRPFIRLETL